MAWRSTATAFGKLKYTACYAPFLLKIIINLQLNEDKKLNISGVIGSSIPKPPEPPLSRVLRDGVGHFCTNCGSTVSKDGFLGLFGEMLCHNQKCPNSKSKKNYR